MQDEARPCGIDSAELPKQPLDSALPEAAIDVVEFLAEVRRLCDAVEHVPLVV